MVTNQNECSVVHPFYGLQRLVAKFETTGSLINQPTPLRQRNARSTEDIAAVREYVQQNSRLSIPRHAQELGLHIGLHPNKIQLIQEIKFHDHRQDRLFADWASKCLEKSSVLTSKIAVDETTRGSQVTIHPTKSYRYRCGFWAGSVIGVYFFENFFGVTVTVNGERCQTMITISDGPN